MADVEPTREPRPCPVCGEALVAERKHDIEVDVCEEHGIWLDAGELETVVGRLNMRAIRRRRRSERSARRSGKMSGALWGWWSLLGD